MDFKKIFSLGNAEYDNGNYIKAIQHYEQILQHSNNFEECYFYIGLCYENLQYEAKAIEYYNRGIKICNNPEHISDYHLNIGNCYLMLSRLEDALYHFEESRKCIENENISKFNIGVVYTCQHKYKDALSIFKEIMNNGFNTTKLNHYISFCESKLL